ncbi:MAG: cytochrome c-type biogenesis CcmF C-terminal domain-containing protein, partial [Pseudomonadota bacterium]
VPPGDGRAEVDALNTILQGGGWPSVPVHNGDATSVGHRDKARRLLRLPRADWGKAVGHIGFGITIFGVSALTAWTVEDIRVAQTGDSWEVGAYQVTLGEVREVRGPNYVSTMADLEVSRNGRDLPVLQPEKRIYPVAGMPTTEAAINNGVFRDVYVVVGDPQLGGGWAIRTFIKPFANWIWAGCIIMSLGGILSLTDRRFRVAAGARKAAKAAVPAE